jgi:hypothetical protein
MTANSIVKNSVYECWELLRNSFKKKKKKNRHCPHPLNVLRRVAVIQNKTIKNFEL